MNTKILGVAVVVFLGIIFGLMFSGIQQNLAITQQLAAQQGEIIDLLRVMAGRQTSKADTSGLEKKIDAMVSDIKKAVAAAPKVAQRPQPPQRPPEDLTTVHKIPIGQAIMKGNRKAPITIVGFLDLQCPFSRRFEPVIDQVLKAYPGKVRYVVKHFPLTFHKNAKPAVKAVLAAGEQGKAFEMMGLVMENNTALSEQKFEEIAKTLKLNIRKFKSDLKKNDTAWEKLIKEDYALGMKVGVRGTPTYYLNGRKTKARSLAAFKAEIDPLLKKK